ncbi:IQ and ubiquitin-like domain-containing protein [Patiria miniata]|uniref:Ubiquitin-like domain-containing protein n=1 Tax=Patiria miniata TaxID=46514 RepID=A0A914AAK3_PATMI|nr:IQ and ubiquitin-like domain-containing protein [Patiria miniata]XP_038060892.1 IQ and ubiquitin-like domain-containing protein [Patiria miniata]
MADEESQVPTEPTEADKEQQTDEPSEITDNADQETGNATNEETAVENGAGPEDKTTEQVDKPEASNEDNNGEHQATDSQELTEPGEEATQTEAEEKVKGEDGEVEGQDKEVSTHQDQEVSEAEKETEGQDQITEEATGEGQEVTGQSQEVQGQDQAAEGQEESKDVEAAEGTTPEAAAAESQEAPEETVPEEDKQQEDLEDAGGAEAEAGIDELGDAERTTSQVEKETIGMETEQTDEQHEVDPHAASPMPDPLNATATVKFVLMPSGQVTTMACALSQTMQQLRAHFASELRMQADQLVFMYDGSNVKDDLTLHDLGVGPNGAVQMEISSADPENNPLKALKPKPSYIMPDVITVKVQRDGVQEDIVVEIERSMRHKPFLGGYKHRHTGLEFYNASAQTRPKTRKDNGIEKFCRDTQTVKQKNIRQQTKINTATQMTMIGCYVANMTDKLVVPGRYQTAEEYHAIRLKKVIILQSYFRRWQAKRQVAKLRIDLAKRVEYERQEAIRKVKEKEDRIRREFEKRMNPKSKEDFDLLYHALEKWRKEELDQINATLTGAQRKAALCHLLDQETQLIASIGRHKLEADTTNKQQAIQNFLDKGAAPKKWRSADGKFTEMDTAYTIRARELRDIYKSLNMKYLTQDERLDVLLTLKHTVKEHDCKLTQEIIELIDREADLLMRGVKETNLEGLRKRIATLFLQYVKTPTFNAEAARLLKVPQDPSSLRKNIYFCPSCNSYLPSTEFQLASNSRNVGRCRRCQKMDNDARARHDYSIYRYMLKSLRRYEEAMNDGSRIAFLMQEGDLRYLVENIWSSQSALSAWNDMYDLVLVRWDKDEEWSPWNCILLTKDEATTHIQIEELEKGYGRVFCHKVNTKHTLARNYFSRLPGMAEHMRHKASQPKPGNSIVAQTVLPSKA